MEVTIECERKKKSRIAQRKRRQRLSQAAPWSTTEELPSTTRINALSELNTAFNSTMIEESWPSADPRNTAITWTQSLPGATGYYNRRIDNVLETMSVGGSDTWNPPVSDNTVLRKNGQIPSDSLSRFLGEDGDNPNSDSTSSHQEPHTPTSQTNSMVQEPALHRAVRKGNYDIVLLLLQHEAPINTIFNRGMTPLHLAIQQNDKKIIRLLLEHQADVNSRDEDGATPLDLAIDTDNVPAVQLLLVHGARVQE